MLIDIKVAEFYFTKHYPFDTAIENEIWHDFKLLNDNKETAYEGYDKENKHFYIGNHHLGDFTIIDINLNNKEMSKVITGFFYKSKCKYYKDYKTKSKYKSFIDKWYNILKEQL